MYPRQWRSIDILKIRSYLRFSFGHVFSEIMLIIQYVKIAILTAFNFHKESSGKNKFQSLR
jgi:hypothetical protein